MNSVEVVRALISAGASVDACDSHGNTPLFRAVFSYRGDGAVIALLRDAGADPDAENASGVAPLSLARTIARCAAGQSSLSRSAEVTASSPPAVNAIAMKEFRKNRQRSATTRKREEDHIYMVYREAGRMTHFRRRAKLPGRHDGGDAMATTIDALKAPDSKLASEIAELVRDTETPLLFHHSSRVYHWGALTGRRRGLRFDHELLYAGAMFHDMGLTRRYASSHNRFEVDSANAARDFLRSHGIAESDIATVWTAIALHTTPGIPPHMHPVIALVTSGVEMDVMGFAYHEFTDDERRAVVHAHPRPGHFKEEIIQAFYDGMRHRPETTFGTVNADVLADKDPSFQPENFCRVIRASAWSG